MCMLFCAHKINDFRWNLKMPSTIDWDEMQISFPNFNESTIQISSMFHGLNQRSNIVRISILFYCLSSMLIEQWTKNNTQLRPRDVPKASAVFRATLSLRHITFVSKCMPASWTVHDRWMPFRRTNYRHPKLSVRQTQWEQQPAQPTQMPSIAVVVVVVVVLVVINRIKQRQAIIVFATRQHIMNRTRTRK